MHGEKVLLPNLAAAERACHRRKTRGPFKADRDMTELAKRLQIAPWSAAQVEDREGRFAFDGVEQRRDVLTDVVRARAFPERVGAFVVMLERARADGFELGSRSLHAAS